MSTIAAPPMPKNLRLQVLEHGSTAAEENVIFVHDLVLDWKKQSL
jgi:hypothetical protein